MTPDAIKKEIIKKGFSLTMIADVLGKSPSMVSKVVNGSATSLLIADCICRILERPIHEVFPNLYDKSFSRTYKTSKNYKAKKEELRELLRR
ncbi:helix-turn-helix transcriptional regulator [Pseudidiomarina sp. CB1]|uniref:helix-turn-helix domain-containing protein n=1 Tax=Pseudidiomarina sp. CB1 TaxID=2972484 RepID=UPI0021635A05|nr:helix-turn-helix transcriptional regulator [Pseudidiomarina sp. CB1]